MILIIDFGSQTTHLIGRRIREMGVEVKIIPAGYTCLRRQEFKRSPEFLSSRQAGVTEKGVKGIILSGGPSSVYVKNALLSDKAIFNLRLPVLGICYGLQVMAHLLGGKVTQGKKKEYGPATFHIKSPSKLFEGLPKTLDVWMSHFDEVIKPPTGAVITGSTSTIKVGAFADDKRRFFGIQFHPEVQHTPYGREMLANFVFNICGEKPTKKRTNIKKIVADIKDTIREKKAICALSGGIDSAVAAVLTYKAIGDRLTCFYVDTGLMRLEETKQVIDTFKKHFKLSLKVIQAQDIFLKNLKGIVDPERKRKAIGETFIRVFESEAKKLDAEFLIQGTIYPDVIESKGSQHADKIKTHHNVGGLPEKHGFKILEPVRMYYKDEVREIAKTLDFPKELIHRHVYPGPGLAVRIIGEVTREKLNILRRADKIVAEEIKKAGFYEKTWMAFAVFTGIKTTGVTGDERKYGETIALRVIESKDAMTADWVRLPYEVLSKISNRIVTEVFEVVRVVYDITTKPPATMEWE